MVLIFLQICERGLEYPSLTARTSAPHIVVSDLGYPQRIVRVLQTSRAVDERLANIADGEGRGRFDGIPVLLREWVASLLQAYEVRVSYCGG